MYLIQQLRLLLGIYDKDELLDLLLEQSESFILDYIGRDKLPRRLEDVKVQLAVIAYNKMGAEGSISRAEGGVSQRFSDNIPDEIMNRLKYYPRKAGFLKNKKVD